MYLPHWVDNATLGEELMEYSDAEDPSDTEPLRRGELIHLDYIRLFACSHKLSYGANHSVLVFDTRSLAYGIRPLGGRVIWTVSSVCGKLVYLV